MHKNFYESLDEADRRLLGTVVTYDGEPVKILAITNHRSDGIFRLYIWPVKEPVSPLYPSNLEGFPKSSPALGQYLDEFMAAKPNTPLLRKHANSPAFNKFRPFPLGMINRDGGTLYLERSSERRTQQGLVTNMVRQYVVALAENPPTPYGRISADVLSGPAFYDCVKGVHPSAEECMTNLRDPSVENVAAACDRHFAVVKGPLDLLFVGYKTEVVGFIPEAAKKPEIVLGRRYRHLREVVEDTRQFTDISVRT